MKMSTPRSSPPAPASRDEIDLKKRIAELLKQDTVIEPNGWFWKKPSEIVMAKKRLEVCDFLDSFIFVQRMREVD